MMRWLRSPSLLAGLVLVGALVSVALWPSSVAVDLSRVERGSMRTTIDEEGETRVRERFVVSAPVAGRVLRIELEPGDRVRRGETVLATFLPAAPAPLDVRTRAEAEAAEAAAEAAVETARTAEDTRRAAQFATARAEHEREMARARLVTAASSGPAEAGRQLTIRSPIDGVV